jgi:hemerythrin-like domain-containing protein
MSLPGFAAPSAGFDAPLDMLHACHDRVRRSLDLLRKVCERVQDRHIDEAVHSAAADVLRYFDKAAPHHHEDEEQHIFPRVLSATQDAAVRNAVLQLQADHQAMEALWARLRTPLAALASGYPEGFGASQIDLAHRFCDLYDAHARTEERLVFPIARELLGDEDLLKIGEEMAGRRGARKPGTL